MDKIIFLKKKEFYYFDTYRTWDKAYKIAKYHKRKSNSDYYILITKAYWTTKKIYRLYLTNVINLTPLT